MLYQRLIRTDPEKIWMVVKNSYSTASLTNGQVVSWDLTDADGIGVTKPAAGDGMAVAGVVAATITSGAYGLIQVYGYHSAVRMRNITGGSPAIAAGGALCMSQALFCAENISTASTAVLRFPFGFALAAQASWTSKAVAAFIKAM